MLLTKHLAHASLSNYVTVLQTQENGVPCTHNFQIKVLISTSPIKKTKRNETKQEFWVFFCFKVKPTV